MDPKQTAEILKTCESIGFADGENKYIAEPDWDVCVKDLILYLRRDDDDHTIRRLLGQTQVVGRDLLPLFKHYQKEENVWEVALRLLQNLTHPVFLLYEEEIPKNKKYLNYYHILEGHLRAYKEAFVDKAVWKSLAEKLRHLLDLEWDKRMEQDKLTIERILILCRNILTIPADPAEERRADDDTSLHDRILMVMHLSGFSDLILYMMSSDTTEEFSVLILEILSCMLREQTGEQLAKTQLARNEDDKIKDELELIRMREKEAVLKNIQLQKLPTRHSRFGGTFVVRDMKAPSGKDILCHKPITSVADLSLDSLKKRKKVASNRKALKDEEGTRRSTIPIRIILKEFCAAILDGKYNNLMHIVKDNINRSRTEDNDETYYLWALKFFMEFNRHHQFRLTYVKETMSTQTFHYVQTLLDRYQGMMATDKEKLSFWSRRAHMALKAYQELLFSLLWIDKDPNEAGKGSSRTIKNTVFYLPEYRELCLGLLNTYDSMKLSKLYLRDLIETNHLFLKMLEDYSSRNRRVMVKCRGKKRKSKKDPKKRKKARKDETAATTSSDAEKVDGEDGKPEATPTDENEMTAVPEEDADNEKEIEKQAILGGEDADDKRGKNTDDEEDEEEEEEEERAVDIEQEFDFKGFLLKYASARVVCNYAFLFQDWDTLKPLTLHCIMKMFHRFVFDMDYPALICQASLFLTFKKILEVADHRCDLREVKTFFTHFWPKFAKLCENKKMFIEILFWKTAREAQEIQDGYAELRGDNKGKSKKKSDWTNDEDEELELLVELYKDSPEEVKKAQKLIEYIMERWTHKPRSKRVFINRLTEKELVDPTQFVKKKRPPKTWAEEEVAKLRELYEEFKDSDDIMNKLLTQMELKRSRKAVVQKLIDIGLIQDKNDVKKRGKRSNQKSRSQISRDSDSENENEREHTNQERKADSGSDSSSSDSSSSDSDTDDANDIDSSPSGRVGGGNISYDEEKLIKLGKELLEKDMAVAIRWVKQSFKYYLEDIIEDPDSDESVPLVPIDAECILAVGNSDFKTFLKLLGVAPPGEQETYWRIPSQFKKRDVDLRLNGIEKIFTVSTENETLSNNNVASSGNVSSHKNDSSDDGGNDSDSRSSITTKRSFTSTAATNAEDSDLDNNYRNRKSRLVRKNVVSDSDSSDSDTEAPKQDKLPEAPPSDLINTERLNAEEIDSNSPLTAHAVVDPGSDSDSNEENDFGIVVKKKRAFIIDSDSDGE